MLGLMQRLLPKGRNRRILGRRDRNDAVYVFSRGRMVGQAVLMDDSELGVRLRSRAPGVLEAAEYMLDPGAATVSRLKLAWRNESEAGYEIVSQTHLRGFITDPDIEPIRAFWMQASFQQGGAARRGVFSRGG